MADSAVFTVSRPTSGPVTKSAGPTQAEQLRASLRKLLATLIDRAFGLALEKMEGLANVLDDIAARGGLPVKSLLGGTAAWLEGRSPVWGAIRGAVAALSPQTKAVLIVVLVLAVLLLPLTLVVLLLALIVAAVWLAWRVGSR